VLEEVQAKAAPGMRLPLASLAVAVICCVAPSATTGADGDTAMAATSWRTVTAAVSTSVPAVATMRAVPVALAVTRPEASTVATPASRLLQLTATPDMAVPAALYTVAPSCAPAPIASSVAASGSTATRAGTVPGFAVTVTVAVPVRLAALAVT